MGTKFKIDHDGNAFVTKHKGYKLTHPVFSVFVKQLKDTFGKDYGGYKATRNAQAALQSKSFD